VEAGEAGVNWVRVNYTAMSSANDAFMAPKKGQEHLQSLPPASFSRLTYTSKTGFEWEDALSFS